MFQLTRLAAAGIACVGALAATLPVAEAQPAASHGASCFRVTQIQNTRMADLRTLYIRTSARTFYRMNFGADCNNLGTEPLVIHPVDNSGDICGAISVDVGVRGTGQRCIPTDLTRLSPDQVAAIPKQDLP